MFHIKMHRVVWKETNGSHEKCESCMKNENPEPPTTYFIEIRQVRKKEDYLYVENFSPRDDFRDQKAHFVTSSGQDSIVVCNEWEIQTIISCPVINFNVSKHKMI